MSGEIVQVVIFNLVSFFFHFLPTGKADAIMGYTDKYFTPLVMMFLASYVLNAYHYMFVFPS